MKKDGRTGPISWKSEREILMRKQRYIYRMNLRTTSTLSCPPSSSQDALSIIREQVHPSLEKHFLMPKFLLQQILSVLIIQVQVYKYFRAGVYCLEQKKEHFLNLRRKSTKPVTRPRRTDGTPTRLKTTFAINMKVRLRRRNCMRYDRRST